MCYYRTYGELIRVPIFYFNHKLKLKDPKLKGGNVYDIATRLESFMLDLVMNERFIKFNYSCNCSAIFYYLLTLKELGNYVFHILCSKASHDKMLKLYCIIIPKKKGTFDFKNPRFKNSYHKKSSNSTDFH